MARIVTTPQPSQVGLTLRVSATFCAAILALACSNESPEPSEETGGFISHVPGRANGDGDIALGDGSESPPSLDGNSGDGDAAGDGDGGDGDGDSPERAIAEADIIQLDGNLLYALSAYSGLSVVDLSDPSDLKLIGNHRSSGDPFEMYLEGSVAYVMYNSWYSYEYDDATESYTWQTTSRMRALDLTDPSNIQVLGDLEVPGQIADSRKVGDVIYLATHQSVGCWDCDAVANSRVTSFDVSDPSDFTPVDSEVFQTADGWQRSISVTSERIYISGFDWDARQNDGGTIDVVDISDPSGVMSKGATISIAGQIESRWQMDEFEETLRVVSQPGGWGTTNPPVVETFRVNSASDIVPLASLEMVLPRPEDLRSVRFDGARAFAITFEQTDPLFTFDLSDPANPLQLGELEIPGWVYHMEPRGDRIYALGFDDTSKTGSLHVSLFDVSDMENPVQMDRVNFGGDWGGFAEDQDRIHKAFNILMDEGLILVPFYGGSYDELSCSYNQESGIQLVDMTTDSLTLRGVAPQVGSARRALFHEGTLFGIGDNAVQAFDISDRDAPEKLDQLDVARNVSSIRLMGSTMLRFGSDWWTGQTVLDFASLNAVTSAEALGEIDLSSLEDGGADEFCSSEDGNYSYSYSNWANQVFVFGTRAFVPRYTYQEEQTGEKWTYLQTLEFLVVDISERSEPKLIGSFKVDPADYNNSENFAGIVKTESALLVGRRSPKQVINLFGEDSYTTSFHYDVIDMSSPEEPVVAGRFEVPSLLSDGGYGYGIEGCMLDGGWGWWGGYGTQSAIVSGDIVASQHEEPLSDDTGRVRYYLDRLDVSDPADPVLLSQVNIPGKLVHYDHSSGRIVTIDYLAEATPAATASACYERNNYQWVDYDDRKNTCYVYRRQLNVLDLEGDTAVLKDSRIIDNDAYASSIAVSNSHIFYQTFLWDNNGDAPPETVVTALTYDDAGEITRVGEAALPRTWYYGGSLVARDGRAFLTGDRDLTVFDATGDDLEMTTHEMGGYWCSQLEVKNDVAYCAMGEFGVQSFALD